MSILLDSSAVADRDVLPFLARNRNPVATDFSRPYAAVSSPLRRLPESRVRYYARSANRAGRPCSTEPILPSRYIACTLRTEEHFHEGVIKSLIIASAAAVVLAPMQARADGFVTPWVGSAFGSNIKNGQPSIGVSAGGMGAGIIGGEVDFGWSPSFFGTKSDFGNNTVMNLMGNVIIGVPIGGTSGAGVRPYVVGGVGLIRSQIDGGTIARVSSSTNISAGTRAPG